MIKMAPFMGLGPPLWWRRVGAGWPLPPAGGALTIYYMVARGSEGAKPEAVKPLHG